MRRHRCFRSETACRVELLSELTKEGIQTLQLDVTSAESVQKAVDTILTEAGRIDAVVCSAGTPCSAYASSYSFSDQENHRLGEAYSPGYMLKPRHMSCKSAFCFRSVRKGLHCRDGLWYNREDLRRECPWHIQSSSGSCCMPHLAFMCLPSRALP